MNKPINMVAGENIPYAKEAFAGLGNLTFLPGRSITSADLKDTNVLLIRSITKVDEALLKGSPVEFVGSASAGTDHIDEAYLKARNIGFTSAAGSNANSVAEYVIASLLTLENHHDISLKGKTIGIVGVGNIGKLVKNKAEALGMHPVLNDPPLAEVGQFDHRSLKETLACDVVTLHTPFTTGGPYPTYHMLNEQTLKWLKPSAIFINAARGEVVDTHALLDALTHKRVGPTVIDVWEHEPDINWNLFQAVTLGTPHIAGHSLDAKANGTFMIYAALCKHLGVEPTWNPVQSLPPPVVPSLEMDTHQKNDEEILREIVTKIYDVEADYRRMRQLLTAPPEERPRLFDGLRKNYPVRREFHRTGIKLPKNQKRLRNMLAGIGFSEISDEQ
jgi:erythronate-4-phosphate dehydrogenase